jgi:hypothetical protein
LWWEVWLVHRHRLHHLSEHVGWQKLTAKQRVIKLVEIAQVRNHRSHGPHEAGVVLCLVGQRAGNGLVVLVHQETVPSARRGRQGGLIGGWEHGVPQVQWGNDTFFYLVANGVASDGLDDHAGYHIVGI